MEEPAEPAHRGPLGVKPASPGTQEQCLGLYWMAPVFVPVGLPSPGLVVSSLTALLLPADLGCTTNTVLRGHAKRTDVGAEKRGATT